MDTHLCTVAFLRGLAGPAGFVSGEGVLHVGQNALLRGAGQLADALKHLAGLPCRASAPLGIAVAQKLLGSNAQDTGQLGQLLGAQGDGVAFPIGVTGLVDAQLGRNLGLGQPGGLAGCVQACAKLAALGFGRSASLHGPIIRANR